MFILNWLTFYCAVMFAMCTDNMFWIKSSPEYKLFREWSLKEKLDYIICYRIKTVLTDWRDIVPAIITSLLMTIILR